MSTLIVFSYGVAGLFVLLGLIRGAQVAIHNGKVLEMARANEQDSGQYIKSFGKKYGWIELVGAIGAIYLVVSWMT